MKDSSKPPQVPIPPLLRIAARPPLAPRLAGLLSGRPGVPLEVVAATAEDVDPDGPAGGEGVLLLSTAEAIEAEELALLASRRPVVLHLANAAIPETALVELWHGAIGAGVQDVLFDAELATPAGALRLHAAAQRHRLAGRARMEYSTDLSTGLPHRQQLLEHMSQLLALRRREPAPMALLVLEAGIATAPPGPFGAEEAAVLRRKLAVRLRSGLRASDVVASLGKAGFAVLLASVEEASHVEMVVAKLVALARRPLMISGQPVGLAINAGVALYPDDGETSDVLLQHAQRSAAMQGGAKPSRGSAPNDPQS